MRALSLLSRCCRRCWEAGAGGVVVLRRLLATRWSPSTRPQCPVGAIASVSVSMAARADQRSTATEQSFPDSTVHPPPAFTSRTQTLSLSLSSQILLPISKNTLSRACRCVPAIQSDHTRCFLDVAPDLQQRTDVQETYVSCFSWTSMGGTVLLTDSMDLNASTSLQWRLFCVCFSG